MPTKQRFSKRRTPFAHGPRNAQLDRELLAWADIFVGGSELFGNVPLADIGEVVDRHACVHRNVAGAAWKRLGARFLDREPEEQDVSFYWALRHFGDPRGIVTPRPCLFCDNEDDARMPHPDAYGPSGLGCCCDQPAPAASPATSSGEPASAHA